MPLSGNDRAGAIYAAVSGMSSFKGLNAQEQATVKTQLQNFFGADTSYLIANTTVLPSSLSSPSGQAVQVTPASGQGTTVSPNPITGTGKIS